MRQERNGKNKTKDMSQRMFPNKKENTKTEIACLPMRQTQGGGV
jgi:hypothetical protein